MKADGNIKKAPAAPRWLDKYARAEWSRVVPILVERRILTEADFGSLESYCCAIGTVHKAQEELNQSSLTVVSHSGAVKANPLLKISADAMTRARLLAAELGLTPVSRSRANVSEAAGDDDEAADLGL